MDPVIKDILEVATAEFAEHGFAGARVDAIAAKTRTSKRMIYYHFGSKNGLYEAVLSYAYDGIQTSWALPNLEDLSPMQALACYAQYVYCAHAHHPAFVRLVMGENMLGGKTVKRLTRIRESGLAGLNTLEGILARGRADGSMRGDVRSFDVYANLVGMSFHFVSNRATFSSIFESGLKPDDVQAARERSIVDTILRQVSSGLQISEPVMPDTRSQPARDGVATRRRK
ncbi:MAG: hypothetical protein RI906_2499 [Pseudomonadota bacterium]|jgi:AcrR family transcriptional regulator